MALPDLNEKCVCFRHLSLPRRWGEILVLHCPRVFQQGAWCMVMANDHLLNRERILFAGRISFVPLMQNCERLKHFSTWKDFIKVGKKTWGTDYSHFNFLLPLSQRKLLFLWWLRTHACISSLKKQTLYHVLFSQNHHVLGPPLKAEDEFPVNIV